MYRLYKKIADFHFPHLQDDTKKALIWDLVYQLEPQPHPARKVRQIFKQVFNLAYSLSSPHVQCAVEIDKSLTLNNYASYLLNSIRLLFCNKLPVGIEYLDQPEIRPLSLEEK